MKNILLTLAVLSSLARCLAAQAAGSLYLLEEPSARARAAGGAYTAKASGPESLRYNPAGLAWEKSWGLELTRANESDDWTHNWLALSGAGLGIEYMNASVPPVQLFDGYGNAGNTVNIGGQSLGLGAAHTLFSESLAVGVGLKAFRGDLAGYSNQGLAVDLGAQYRFKAYPAAIGISSQNLGWQSAFVSQADPLPNGLRAGLECLVVEAAGLKLDAMADYLSFPGVATSDRVRGGAELSFKGLAFASVGVQNSSLGDTYSFGGGVSLFGVSLAYAAQTGYFPGLTQVVSLNYSPRP